MPYFGVICKCANLTCTSCNERTVLMKFLLSYDDDYIRDRPYDLHYAMMINKGIKDISKGTLPKHRVN